MDQLIKKSILIEDGNPARYRLQTTTDNLDESESYRKITFGERDPEKPHKTLLMVGETGTGKTTLINTMINYMCGVKREDKIWFEITDDKSDKTSCHSQTSIITVYGVYIQETSLDLTIIDTPGYGNTLDQQIAMDLLSLCTSKGVVHKIDAVCHVMVANLTRLTDRQRYIFDAVQCLFGKDIGKNIVLLFTHSTCVDPENTLTAVKEAEVKCAVDEENQPRYYLFNNCQSETYDKEYQTIQDQSWDLSYNGMACFLKFLKNITPETLKMTRSVLQKRKQLKANMFSVQSLVQEMKQKQKQLEDTEETLKKQQQNYKESKFEYEAENSYKEKIPINPSICDLTKQATCCSVCEENCHYPGCWWFCDLKGCSVMKDDHCTVCTDKCHISKHVKEAKIYETTTKTEMRLNEDLKKKYDDEIENSLALINQLEKDLQESEKEKIKLVTEAYNCVEILEMIALNTDSLFILQHIDFLIEKLKEINEPEKAETLENVKKKPKYI